MSKVAVVTGASRGIGRACALRLAKDGIDVVVNYNSNEEEAMKVVNAIKDMGCDAIAVKANVANQKDVASMFREAYKHFGHIDILVNNAGVVDDAYLLMLNNDSLDRSLDINIKGYFYCSQQAALKMFKQKSGIKRKFQTCTCRTVGIRSNKGCCQFNDGNTCQGTGSLRYPGQCGSTRIHHNRDD
mgnify:CR=1 FL=1